MNFDYKTVFSFILYRFHQKILALFCSLASANFNTFSVKTEKNKIKIFNKHVKDCHNKIYKFK